MKEIFEKWYLYALAFIVWLVIGTKDFDSLPESILSFLVSLFIAVVFLMGARFIFKIIHVILNMVGFIPIKIFKKISKK